MTYSDKATQLISDLKSMHGKSRDMVVELIETLHNEDKLPYDKVRDVVFTELPFISRATIYRALPQEVKRDYTKPISDSSKVSYETIDRVEQSVPVPEIAQDDSSVSTSIDESSDTFTDTPVYKEPDRVEPRPTWNKDKMDTEQEQQFNTNYHRMNVVPNVPVSDVSTTTDTTMTIDSDYTVTTQLQIYNGTGNNVGQFTVDVVAKCYPSRKTVELQPIDKATIKKVSQ